MKKCLYTALLLLLVVGLSACDSGFEELNQNPNAPTEAGAEFILPRAIQTSTDRLYSMSGLNGYIGSLFSQQFAKIQYTDEDKYDFSGRTGLSGSIWEGFYSRSLQDLNQIIVQAENGEQQEKGNPASYDDNQKAIAMILMAWNYQVATDLWGDIPYSEALQGMSEEAVTNPQYDAQEDIYKDLIAKLKTAVGLISEGNSPFSSSDLIYGGDMAKWTKLANSLRMRLAMRLSEVDPGYAETEFVDAYNSTIMTSLDDNAEVEYGSYPYNNPVNDFERSRVDHKFSLMMDTTMINLDDPRRRIYAMPVANDSVRALVPDGIQGVQNGDENNSKPLAEVSTMGAYFISPASPGRVMTYAEVKFLEAEAMLRGWITGDPETAYNEAVTTAMEMYSDEYISGVLAALSSSDQAYIQQSVGPSEDVEEPAYDGDMPEFEYPPSGITDAEITTYLAGAEFPDGPAFPSSGMEDQMNALALQKWIALYGQGAEAWFEWRRLDYPMLEPGPKAVLDDVPTRFDYPATEESVNGTNWQAAVDRQGTDNFLTKVWWDVD